MGLKGGTDMGTRKKKGKQERPRFTGKVVEYDPRKREGVIERGADSPLGRLYSFESKRSNVDLFGATVSFEIAIRKVSARTDARGDYYAASVKLLKKQIPPTASVSNHAPEPPRRTITGVVREYHEDTGFGQIRELGHGIDRIYKFHRKCDLRFGMKVTADVVREPSGIDIGEVWNICATSVGGLELDAQSDLGKLRELLRGWRDRCLEEHQLVRHSLLARGHELEGRLREESESLDMRMGRGGGSLLAAAELLEALGEVGSRELLEEDGPKFNPEERYRKQAQCADAMARADKAEREVEEYEKHCAKLFDDLRKARARIRELGEEKAARVKRRGSKVRTR